MLVIKDPSSKAQQLLSRLRPALIGGNLQTVLTTVQANWNVGDLVRLLTEAETEVRKTAAVALSLVGDRSAIVPLAIALHDVDEQVVETVEHALWSIWFRSGRSTSPAMLSCGCRHLNHRNIDTAIEKFSMAISIDPDFAEAFNQRAIAHFLGERFELSIADCKAVLARMPQHFGAVAGMGHCHAHLGHYAEARKCYRRALAIHPRLEGIQASLDHIDQLMRGPGGEAGHSACADFHSP